MSYGNSPNPYQPTGKSQAGFGSDEKTKAPGIALIIVGAIGMLLMLIFFILTLVGVLMSPELGNPPPGAVAAERTGFYVGFYGSLIFPIFNLVAQLFVILGGVAMLRRKSIGMARTGAIVSVVPCLSSLCLIGIPFGIWGLIALRDPLVKAAFRKNS